MSKRLIFRELYIAFSLLIVAIMLFTAISCAWLTFRTSEIDASKVGGQLLTNYFHSGTGTAADPFIITRPIHYYNLVNLYQRVSDYSDNAYYFQVGTNLRHDKGDDSNYVYNYDENGNLNIIEDNPYSQVLNLSYYRGTNALLPIGTHDKNFLGHFNGNGLTISNFTVSTLEERDCDIGIFGYVGQGADIHDVYFSNVTIDLSNVRSTDKAINPTSAGQTHNPDAHTVNSGRLAYVGYLAGHVMTNSQFEDVYINNTRIIGGGEETAATSGFAYFGCIERPDGTLVDALGESLPEMTADGIGMNGIYERLTTYRGNATLAPFVVSKKVWIHGELREEFDVISTSVIRENDTESSAGSFSFSKDSPAADEGDTVYLTGQTKMAQAVTTYTVTDNDGFYLASESGNTYVFMNDEKNGLTADVPSASGKKATVWALDNSGYCFTTEIDDVNHECIYYYLSAESTEAGKYNAAITTDIEDAVLWTYNSGLSQLSCDVGGEKLYLSFSGEKLGGSAGGSTAPIIQSVYGSTTYYLRMEGTTAVAVTDPALATEFEKDGGFWKIREGTNSQYLNASISKVTVSSTKMTFSYANNCWMQATNIIEYDGTKWKLRALTPADGFNEFYLFRNITADDTNYFLGLDNSNTLATYTADGSTSVITVPTNSVLWTLPLSTTEFGYMYTTIGTTNYYLTFDNSNYTKEGSYYHSALSLTTDASQAVKWKKNSNYFMANVKLNGKNTYLAYDGVWKASSSTAIATIKYTLPLNGGDSVDPAGGENLTTTAGTINLITHEIDSGAVYDTVVLSELPSNDISFPIDTWFPILAGGDGAPTSDNFGYVVSGMEYKQDDLYRSGDIWVRESPIDSLFGSYSEGALTNVYTVNGSGLANADEVAAFRAYRSMKGGFEAFLSTKSSIHGLRFMGLERPVSADDVVTVPSATINGYTYTDLALPRHCVDISLDNDGSIKLFAGNYYSGNTGFFSLYHVIRNGNAIEQVKKISKIYKVGASIYYVYDGESSPYNANDLVFDSAWMSGPITMENSLYYFEIPMAAGEYALGAVDESDSAYLLYLSTDESEPVIGEGNGLTSNNFIVDVRSTGYVGSAAYVDHSLLQFAIDAPAASPLAFSVEVSFDDSGLPAAYENGLYTISIVNRTGAPIGLTVYLCDDDNISGNAYLYAYQVVYTNAVVTDQTMMNGAKTYFQGCAELMIP